MSVLLLGLITGLWAMSGSFAENVSHPEEADLPAKAEAEHRDVEKEAAPPRPLRRLEPTGHRVLHGIGQSRNTFREYYDQVGDEQKPVFDMVYWGMHQRVVRQGERYKAWLDQFDEYVIPQLGLNLKGRGPEFLAGLASGEQDRVIDDFVRALKIIDRPMFVRIGYEFNGEWNGYDPKHFRETWVRIAKAIREAGLDEVALVWCYAVEGMHQNYMDWYPGDAYVDWWAIDLFSPEHLTSGATHRFIEQAAARGYPVMIGECSPRWVQAIEGERSWDAWFVPFFNLIEKHENLKAFSYITYDWGHYYRNSIYLKHWGDARVWRDELVWERWQKELARDRYLHGASREKVRDFLNLQQKPAAD